MIIQKKYHFYAAHRNHAVQGKCRNIHGHTYYVTVYINPGTQDANTGVTILFDDIDNIITPVVKQFDHKMLLSKQDPLYDELIALSEYIEFVEMQGATSVENVCILLFDLIRVAKIPIVQIDIQETTTSIVTYTGELNVKNNIEGIHHVGSIQYPTFSE